jgi:peptide/nickel transport system permease protein
VIGTSGTAGMIRRLRANLLDELRNRVSARPELPPFPADEVSARMSLNPFIDIGGSAAHHLGRRDRPVVLNCRRQFSTGLLSLDVNLAGAF